MKTSANIPITLILGLLLARFVSTLPYESPCLPAGIASVMRLAGIDTVENADDIETIGLLEKGGERDRAGDLPNCVSVRNCGVC
ncbi:hypothetical protein [Agrobacterium vitis]|uniref:hypothetical protein n=1 Tax=Agrobacterium vitis TaxID=373 RepID=UPI00157319AE|nr:hypothetical protein [Agrobacterium vitis]NSZ16093.1 hypothetical protein [Agrobacterium vitis]QZO04869.1 hypothetical protein K4831_04840 [Agrobacterium vitis]UJL87014.1 hypothetical protein AVF2S5_03175 [Agrobacterium vitis]